MQSTHGASPTVAPFFGALSSLKNKTRLSKSDACSKWEHSKTLEDFLQIQRVSSPQMNAREIATRGTP